MAARRRTLAKAVGPTPIAFTLEQLEARQLLAGLTISESKISGGADLVYTDAESITVGKDVILNAGGGKITLTAPVIKIGDGAQLLSKGTGNTADGAITLKAANTTAYVKFTAADMVKSWFAGTKEATVSLGKRAIVDGGSFTIDVSAGDEKTFNGTINPVLGSTVDGIAEIIMNQLGVNELLASPLSVMVKQPSSAISVDDGASITSSGDVSIKGR